MLLVAAQQSNAMGVVKNLYHQNVQNEEEGCDPGVAGLLCWVFLPCMDYLELINQKEDKKEEKNIILNS